MSLRLPIARRASLPGALLLLAACAAGASDPATQWAGTVDTLASGAVHVRSPAEGLWRDSASAWRLEEELRIGSEEGGEPGAFSQVNALAVDAAGRVWVLDRPSRALQLFDADGRHLRTVGREGSGPGEFRDPIGLARDAAGTLWVVDPGNARYALFDSAGRYQGMYRREIGGYSVPWRGGVDDGGHLLDQLFVRRDGTNHAALVRYAPGGPPVGGDAAATTAIAAAATDASSPDAAGALVARDTILLPPPPPVTMHTLRTTGGGSIGTTPPFSPGLAWMLDGHGDLWFGNTGEYRIHRQRLGGDTLRILERAATPPPVTDADRAHVATDYEWFTRQGGSIADMTIPSTKPHYTSFFTDEAGNLWVRPTRERDATGSRFEIFDAEGRYLGALESPLRISTRTPVFAGGRMYAVALDENDVSYVVRLRVVKDRER